jgi:hypothetical protein
MMQIGRVEAPVPVPVPPSRKNHAFDKVSMCGWMRSVSWGIQVCCRIIEYVMRRREEEEEEEERKWTEAVG